MYVDRSVSRQSPEAMKGDQKCLWCHLKPKLDNQLINKCNNFLNVVQPLTEKIIVVLLRGTKGSHTNTHILHYIVFLHLHTCPNVCQGQNCGPYLWKKKNQYPLKAFHQTHIHLSVQLPGKVVSGKAPVAFKSQHWAFPDENVVHYLCVSFQAIRLACANF